MLTVNARYDRPTLDGAETREDDESSWLGGSLVSAWCCVASITCGYGLVCVGVLLFLCFCLWPYQDEMTQSCRLSHESSNGLVVCHSCGCWFFVWLFLVFSCFCCLFAVVCFVCGNDGFLGYVQVRHQFSLAVLNQQTASRFNLEINDFAMPWGVLNDLAKAMKALDGKKKEKMMKACMRPLKVQRPCWITCAQTRVLHCFKNIGWRQIRFNKQPSD